MFVFVFVCVSDVWHLCLFGVNGRWIGDKNRGGGGMYEDGGRG